MNDPVESRLRETTIRHVAVWLLVLCAGSLSCSGKTEPPNRAAFVGTWTCSYSDGSQSNATFVIPARTTDPSMMFVSLNQSACEFIYEVSGATATLKGCNAASAAPSDDPNKDSKTPFESYDSCAPVTCGRPFVVRGDTMTGAFASLDQDGGVTTWGASCKR